METFNHAQAFDQAGLRIASRLYVNGQDDGMALVLPRSDHWAYLDGWADGHDLYMEAKAAR